MRTATTTECLYLAFVDQTPALLDSGFLPHNLLLAARDNLRDKTPPKGAVVGMCVNRNFAPPIPLEQLYCNGEIDEYDFRALYADYLLWHCNADRLQKVAAFRGYRVIAFSRHSPVDAARDTGIFARDVFAAWLRKNYIPAKEWVRTIQVDLFGEYYQDPSNF